ncbi:unnamed protein product, partial [Amoebophrya sp. A25]
DLHNLCDLQKKAKPICQEFEQIFEDSKGELKRSISTASFNKFNEIWTRCSGDSLADIVGRRFQEAAARARKTKKTTEAVAHYASATAKRNKKNDYTHVLAISDAAIFRGYYNVVKEIKSG